MKGKGGLVVLVLLICTLTLVVGQRYYNYTQSDPDFCSTCHLMQEAYKSWGKSRHNKIICQECHGMNLVEENRLLVAFVAGNTTGVQQEHGRTAPWKICLQCHSQEAAQGSLTLRASYGHARHVFMQNITCQNCHRSDQHDLAPDQSKCQNCHKDKLVHGMGTAGLLCLSCHSFGDSTPSLVSTNKCHNCHADVPQEGIMSRLACFECHHPHDRLKMDARGCLGSCHGEHINVGLHGRHLKQTNVPCKTCHVPHVWEVGKKRAVGLCDRCHSLRDPNEFVF